MLSWMTGCLALRTRNGGLKNSFSPGELSPLIQLLPRSGNVSMMGFLTNTFQYVRLPDLKVDLLFLSKKDKKDNTKKEIYAHFTCATDTGNIRFVFDAASYRCHNY